MALSDKVLISELEEMLMTITPTFGLPSFKEILRIHVLESYYKVMLTLVRTSLIDFERKSPLYMNPTVLFKGSEYTFKDNFEAFRTGILDEKYVTLVPESVTNITGSLLYGARNFVYDKPVLSNAPSHIDCLVSMRTLCHRPVYTAKQPNEDEFIPEAAIYGLDLYSHDGQFYLKVLMLKIIDYIIELKGQAAYSDIPVEIYSGLSDKQSKIDAEVEAFFTNSVGYHRLWR